MKSWDILFRNKIPSKPVENIPQFKLLFNCGVYILSLHYYFKHGGVIRFYEEMQFNIVCFSGSLIFVHHAD
jgi:hypothetical protein